MHKTQQIFFKNQRGYFTNLATIANLDGTLKNDKQIS
jgi:hypothetical protein